MLSTWSAIREYGCSAGWARRQSGRVLLGLALVWLAGAGLVTAAPATDKVLRLRVLVLSATSNSETLTAIQSSLDYIGIPYDTWVVADHPGAWNAAVLAQGNLGRYCAVLLADGQLIATGNTSAFTAAEWQVLWDYTSAFRVREVAWYTYPVADYGFATDESLGNVTVAATLTPTGLPLFPYLNTANPITLAGGSVDAGTVAAGATAILQDSSARALGAHRLQANGRETVALTFECNRDTRHHKLLAYGLINWATRGVFRGERRVYMGPQVDDVMIADLLRGGASFRLTATDWNAMTTWLTARQSTPQFAGFRYYFPFNGEGKDGYGVTPDTLMPAIAATKDRFHWINHTFGHPLLDAVSYSEGLAQLQLNQDTAVALGLTSYDRRNLVTPEISGLANASFMQAAYDFGVRFMVSDASVAGQGNPRPNVGYYHALQPGILMLPREALQIDVDCSTPAELVAGYNLANGTSLTYAEILDRESDGLLDAMIEGSVNPWMFHQSNLRAYDGVHSLLSDVLDRTMTKYQGWCNLPVVCPPMQDLGATVAARMACDAAPVDAYLVGGREVVLYSPRAVAVPLTGVAFGGEQWTYGGQSVSRVALAARQTLVVPLAGGTAAPGLTLTLAPQPLAENGGAAAGHLTVRRQNVPLTAALTVTLTAYSPRFTVPPTVVIPAGTDQATVPVGTVNNALDDGDAAGLLLGSGDGLGGATVVVVADDEAPNVIWRYPVPGTTVTTWTLGVNVTFDEAVQGVDASDLVVSGSAGGGVTVGPPTNISGNTWRFLLGNLVNGLLELSLAPDAGDITDLAGSPVAPVAWSYPVDAQFPEIEVTSAGGLIVDGDSTPGTADGTDFGLAPLGSSTVRTFTVHNVGTQALHLTGTPRVALSGAAAADFAVTLLPASPVAANGGSTTCQVRFTAGGVGLRSAVLSIANDDADEAPYNFAIQGTGVGEGSGPAHGDMETGAGTTPAGWTSFGTAAATWATDQAHAGTHSLKLVGDGGAAGWTGTPFAPPEPQPYTITVGAWSRAANVVAPTSYALVINVILDDGTTAAYSTGLGFSAGTHGWEYRSRTVTFDRHLRVIQPSFRFAGGSGTVWFDDVTVKLQPTVSRNFMAEDAAAPGATTPDNWWTAGQTLTDSTGWVTDQRHGGSRALKIVTTAGTNAAWGNAPFVFTEPYPQHFTVRGWSRADNVAAAALYALNVTFVLEDSTTTWVSSGLQFSAGTHDWQEVVKQVSLPQGVKQVRVEGVLYGGTGTQTVWFDEIEVIPAEPRTPNYRAELGALASGPADWTTFNQGLTRVSGWDAAEHHSGARALKTVNSTGANAGWMNSTASFSAPYPTVLALGGGSKAAGVAASATHYGLAFYVTLADNSLRWHQPATLAFARGTHDWEQKETLGFFPQGVKQVRAYAVLYGGTGTQTAWFDDVYATRYEPVNRNSTVEAGEAALGPSFWATAGQSLTRATGWATDAARSGARSLKLVTTTGGNAYWATVKVGFGAPYPRSFTVGAANKADNVAAAALYALALNVEFADGTTTTSYGAYNAGTQRYELFFQAGTHGWESLQQRVVFPKDVKAITPILLLYRGSGVQTAWFDDIFVIPE